MLTDKSIQALKPRAKPYRVADGESLFVQVSPSGALLWRLRYRFGGKAKTLALGIYPKVKGAEARKLAGEARQLLEDGTDPGAVRKAEIARVQMGAENTFRVLAEAWMKHTWPTLAKATKDKQRLYFDQHIYPFIGDKPITAVTTGDVLMMVKKLTGRGVLDIAKRCLNLTQRTFSYAVAHGQAERNPAKDFSAADVIPRRAIRHHTAITDPAQLAGLLRAADAYTGGPVVKAALQLTVLLFQRPGEMRTMEWAELDLGNGLWNLPASKMKTRQPHTLPLPRQAIEIIKSLKPMTGESKYVLPSSRGRGNPLSENTVAACLASIGYGDQQSPHGFRATARTIIAERLNWEPEIVESALAHLPAGALGATYARVKFLEQRKAMHQEYADWLDTIRLQTVTK